MRSHSSLFPCRLIIRTAAAGRFALKTKTSLGVSNLRNRDREAPKEPIKAIKLHHWTTCTSTMMRLYDGFLDILKIQKFRRVVGYTVFYCFSAVVSYAYTSNTTRAGYSRADQYYAAYPAGTELLTDTAKLYKAALGNCFEVEEWGPIEYCIMAKHFERQGKSPYAYHAQYMAHLLSQGELDGSG